MNKREYRRFTAEQKIEMLREADQSGVTVSEVCRRHGLAPSVLYRWRAVAQGGSAAALKRAAQCTPRKEDAEVRHKAQIDRLRAVVAEITAENLELKKRSETGRFIQSPSAEETGSDADRSANQTTLRVAGVSHTGRPGRAAQRVLRMEVARESERLDRQAVPGVRNSARGKYGDL